MSAVKVDAIGRASPRQPIHKICAGEGLAVAIRICKPLAIDATPGGTALILVADPGSIAAAYQSATRSRGLPIFCGDLLAMDVRAVEAFTAEVESMLAAMSGQVLIIEDADALPIEGKALAFALRRLAAKAGLTVIMATAAKK